MRTLLLLVVVLGACKANDKDNLPIGTGGGGGGTGGGSRPDSPTDTGSGSNGASGKVCLMTDPRNAASCAATGASGFTVMLGSMTATTADDGSFTMATPSGTGLVWQVTGSTLVPTLRPYVAGDTQIPAMTTTMFVDDIEADTGDFQIANAGSIYVSVTKAGAALAGAVVTSNPAASYDTAYDGSATIHSWMTVSTGAFGTAFLGDIAVGTATVSVTPSGGTATMVANVPVADASLTFLTVALP